MSRIEENAEMRKQLVELSATAREITTDKIYALGFNSRVICEIMMDISTSLAVIADKLTEESDEEDTDQKSIEEWMAGEEKRWESEEV